MPACFPSDAERTDKIVARLIQHTAFQHGAGGDNADDVALDKPLCERRILHLLADGHLVPLRNQPGDIGLRAVERHAAHRRALLLPAIAPGEGQFQLPRGELCIVKKHFIKVAQAEKQKRVGILLLDLKILLHHRG